MTKTHGTKELAMEAAQKAAITWGVTFKVYERDGLFFSCPEGTRPIGAVEAWETIPRMSDTPRTDAAQRSASYFTGVEMKQAWNLARQLERVLRRIRQWDMLDSCADGEYWKREIDALLNAAPQETNAKAVAVEPSTPDGTAPAGAAPDAIGCLSDAELTSLFDKLGNEIAKRVTANI